MPTKSPIDVPTKSPTNMPAKIPMSAPTDVPTRDLGSALLELIFQAGR